MANLLFGHSATAPVGHVVIGHTTDRSVRIWVQGLSRYPRVKLQIYRTGQKAPVMSRDGCVREKQDYTTCFDFMVSIRLPLTR